MISIILIINIAFFALIINDQFIIKFVFCYYYHYYISLLLFYRSRANLNIVWNYKLMLHRSVCSDRSFSFLVSRVYCKVIISQNIPNKELELLKRITYLVIVYFMLFLFYSEFEMIAVKYITFCRDINNTTKF